jgi:hypothetical protein
MGKGDWRRPTQISRAEADANYEAVFGVRKLNNMSDEDRKDLHCAESQAKGTVDGGEVGTPPQTTSSP